VLQDSTNYYVLRPNMSIQLSLYIFWSTISATLDMWQKC